MRFAIAIAWHTELVSSHLSDHKNTDQSQQKYYFV